MSTSAAHITSVIDSLSHTTSEISDSASHGANSNQPQPLIFSQITHSKTEEKKESVKEFTTEGNVEDFNNKPDATYTLVKVDPRSGVTKISLHKHTASAQLSALTTYSIKVYIDDKNPKAKDLINYFTGKSFQTRNGSTVINIFALDENDDDLVVEAKALKYDQFISTLGKLMIPDEIIQQIALIVRTNSNLYNLSQDPNEDPNDASQAATQPIAETQPLTDEGEPISTLSCQQSRSTSSMANKL